MDKVNQELEILQSELQKLGPAIEILKQTGQFSKDLVKGSEVIAAQGQVLTDSVSGLVNRFSALTEKSEQVAQKFEKLDLEHHFGAISDNQKDIFDTVGKIDQNHDDHKNHFSEKLDNHKNYFFKTIDKSSAVILENIQAQEAKILSSLENITKKAEETDLKIDALMNSSKLNRKLIILMMVVASPIVVVAVDYILKNTGFVQ